MRTLNRQRGLEEDTLWFARLVRLRCRQRTVTHSLWHRGDRLVLVVGSDPTVLRVFGTSIDEREQLDQCRK